MLELRFGDMGYGVQRFPGRKRVCLYAVTGNAHNPVAWFCDDVGAAAFSLFLQALAGRAGGVIQR